MSAAAFWLLSFSSGVVVALLGVVSLLQITLLPGALLLSVAGYRGPALRRLLLSFGLSLTANYVGVFALTLAGLYVRPVVFLIFSLELLAVAWLNRASLVRWFFLPIVPALVGPVIAEVRRRRMEGSGFVDAVRGIAATVVLIAALAGVGRVLVIFAGNWGEIFNFVDTVLSWNRWALDWSRNSLPVWPYHYPQLLPANWSISYVFMDAPLQYFARGMMPLFMLALLLAMIDLAWTTRKASLYWAALVTPFLYERCRIDMAEGLVDVAVSSMAFLSFACLLCAQRAPLGGERHRYLMIGAILAAGAAGTKQAGLYFLLVYPLLARGLVFGRESGPGIRAILRFMAAYLAVIVIVVVPFYLYAELQIRAQLNASEIQYVTQGIFRGTPVPERIVNAGQLLRTHLGDTAAVVCGVLTLVALADRLARWIVLLVVAPFGLIWAAFFSYDLRNLSVALPFVALSVGAGATTIGRAATLLPFLPQLYRQLSRVNGGIVLGLVGAAVIGGVTFGPDLSPERLRAQHQLLQREVGNAALNKHLYDQHGTRPFSGQIVTNYSFLAYLPGLEQLFVFNNLMTSDDLAQYSKYLANQQIGYLLLPTDALPAITRDVEERLKRGDLKELFRAEGYLMVEIVRR